MTRSRRSAAWPPPCRSTGCASGGPGHAYEALECLGGNGYTEAFPLARRYREQPLLAIWEGSGNVIALDVLRVLHREPEAFEAFFGVVTDAGGAHAALDLEIAEAQAVVLEVSADPAGAAARARELTERLALVLQASLLVQIRAVGRGGRVRAHPHRGRRRAALRGAAAGRRHRGDPRAGVSRSSRMPADPLAARRHSRRGIRSDRAVVRHRDALRRGDAAGELELLVGVAEHAGAGAEHAPDAR